MALCHNCDDARIEYIGNGSQTDYTFPFEYNEQTDVAVAFFDDDLLVWERQDPIWDFVNPTTIRFNEAPASGQKFIIYRCTDLQPLPATFHPGHSIKAQDLNDNFFVLDLAIEELRCAVNRIDEKAEEKYWNKVDQTDHDGDTVYYDKPWVSSDDTIATTKASDARFWDTAEQTTYIPDNWASEADDRHIPTTGAVDRHIEELRDDIIAQKITRPQQISGQAEARINDQNFFTSAASKARYDVYSQLNTPSSLAFEQPGKLWYDTETLETYIWDTNAGAWVVVGKAAGIAPGPIGPPGPSGIIIVSDDPPTEHPNGGIDGEPRDLLEGDLWFNSQNTQLFIYYKDNTGFQWVSVTAKGPKGDPGQNADGGPTYTFTAPLVENAGTVSLDLTLLTNA